MDAAVNPDLVSELAALVRAESEPESMSVSAEWSQVGTAHAGRIYGDGERRPLSENAVELFRTLREQMHDDERGAWFSARLGVDPVEFTPNYTDRVYWNSATDSMLQAPDADAVPTDADWQAELRRNPRAAQHVPEWITSTGQTDRQEFIQLRDGLTRQGFPVAAVRLPGEEHVTFEGALLVRELDSHIYSLDVFDYGQLSHVATEQGAQAAGMHAWTYLTAPLPAEIVMAEAELHARHEAAAAGYRALTARLDASSLGGVSTNLAAGVPFDRWGGVDGLYVFAWNTPLGARSLPPSATSDGTPLVTLVANRPVPAQAERAPAWFDQPGGGVRFRLQAPLRDLIRAGELSVVRIP